MTLTPPSRSPAAADAATVPACTGLTLASVLAAIEPAELTPHRARDLRSAILTVARVLGADPATLPAQPRLLARRLDEIAPAAHGIEPARWNNVRSLLRAALALLGPIGPGRHLNPLSPSWQTLVEKNRARLRSFDDPDHVQALVHLPQRLLAEADAMPRGVRSAVLAQTALAIELLLVAPVRIKNLASIDLEQHLVRPGRGRGVVLLTFERDEVKNGQVLDYPLPPGSIALLERYLADYRPLVAPAGSTALFPGRDGQAKGRMVLGPRISKTVFKYTGLKVNPHLFRHIAAKLQLEAEPGSYELVRRVLGHSSIETTTRAYAGTESAAAVRHYDKVVERLRAQQPPLPKAKRRRAA